MNLSTVSVYDNLNISDNSSKSLVYRTINNLLTVNTDIQIRIYCPLCVKCFSFKSSLFEHLKAFHRNFLTQSMSQTTRFKECPFCNAKFYGMHLTVKHALHYHGKVIKGVFVQKNKKCFFCDRELSMKDYNSVVKHIEDKHFLNFEEEFAKMFSCENSLEMSVLELINSSIMSESSANCMNININDCKENLDSAIQDFDEASKINCFDFTDLKQQLDNIKLKQMPVPDSGKKSILKDVTNASTSQKSVRRVLRFDLPSTDEDKENAVLTQNLKTFKQISIDEHSLLCDESKIEKILRLNDTFDEEPQHSSTPNKIKSDHKIKSVKCKSYFKSYITDKKSNRYEFQCGKCKTLFKENVDLVSHVKRVHKMFSLNAFQPCYRCAICNARFYKNYYLRKHHNVHKPY